MERTGTGETAMVALSGEEEEDYILPYVSRKCTSVRILIPQSREGAPNGGGDESSLSVSAVAGGGSALLAIGGYLLVLSLVILQGRVQVGGGSIVTVGGWVGAEVW